MKIALNSDAESSTTGVETGQMAFDTSKQAKLFHMLSSSLYSNKPRSILRELCSNAHDSHVLAGIATAQPFKIIAPTYENPVLVVKDFGVGLTKEEAFSTILCYLGSTKDQSSDFIGGWGIGSKSPFAYTKSYNVICIKNGRRVEFACWKNEHGIPTNAVIDERDTDEPNGVEMHVPVEASDVMTFNKTVRTYMRWTNYNVVADVGGVKVYPTVPIEEIEYKGIPIRLYEDSESTEGGDIRLVYGGESYNIKDCIDSGSDNYDRWEHLIESMHKGYRMALVATTPDIIDFNMNREELEQTPRTVAFVNALTDFLAGEAEARVKTYDAKMQTSIGMFKSDDRLPTMKEVSELIDKVMSEGDGNDRVFARAFKIFEDTYTMYVGGNCDNNLRQLSQRSGVIRIHSLRYMVRPMKDQIAFAYGRTLSPGRSDRSNYWYDKRRNGGADKTVFYVRGNTEAEAIEELKAHPLFADFDFTGYDFHFFNIPVPIRSSGGGRAAPPLRVYDTVTKKYVQYDMNKIFVMRDADSSGEELALFQLGYRLNGGHSTVVAFTPTADFLKRSLPSNIITAASAREYYIHVAKAWMEECGGLSRDGISRLAEFEIFNQNHDTPIDCFCMKCNDAVERFTDAFLHATAISYDVAKMVKEYPGAGVKHVEGLVQLIKRGRKIRQNFLAATEYIDTQKLWRNRNSASARKLIADLKIGEWI